jgi:type III pantothenate kinase
VLCFDIGNTDIHGGVFEGEKLRFEFRRSNQQRPSADELGVFLLQLLAANEVHPASIGAISIASVVPDALPAVEGACEKYLHCAPLVLQAGVKTGLKLRVKEPREVGADRIANAIAAVRNFPGQNVIVVDMGTATTLCAINAKAEYLGGAIVVGMGLSMRALGSQTAKLPQVDIVRPESALGRTTVENIQSGLFFSQLGMLREMTERLREEAFEGEPTLVVGTGGFARLFASEKIFDRIEPALVLHGLRYALLLNRPSENPS